jgi:hypothetical protein
MCEKLNYIFKILFWIASGFAFAMTAAVLQPQRVIANRKAVKQTRKNNMNCYLINGAQKYGIYSVSRKKQK